jgi:hypothetical protein
MRHDTANEVGALLSGQVEQNRFAVAAASSLMARRCTLDPAFLLRIAVVLRTCRSGLTERKFALRYMQQLAYTGILNRGAAVG